MYLKQLVRDTISLKKKKKSHNSQEQKIADSVVPFGLQLSCHNL